jgi:hypothetical protein
LNSLKVPEGIKGTTSAQGDLNDPVSGSGPRVWGSASLQADRRCKGK